ncbi:MAG: hypothetical protein ABUL60_11795 [Myxococcales bacterium]
MALAFGAGACGANEPEDQLLKTAPGDASRTQAESTEVRTAVPVQVSREQAIALLAAGSGKTNREVERSVDAVDFEALRSEILATDGRDRQELLMRYMAAADDLPTAERDATKAKLFEAFQ